MSDLLASLLIPMLAAAGLPVALRVLGQRPDREAPILWATSHAVALVWCMAGGMVLGALDALNAAAVLGWLGAGLLASGSLAWGQRGGPNDLRAAAATFRGFACLGWTALPGSLLLLLATVPPWYRDSLTYHLALPRFFAMQGGTVFPDDNLFASFPLGWESALSFLFTLGAEDGAMPLFNPRLVGAWTMIAVAFAVAGLARRAGAGRGLATCAAMLWLGLPTVIEFGASAYVESALILFACLALWFATRSEGATWPSAVWAGLAAWVKYPALALAPFLLLAIPVLRLMRSNDLIGEGEERDQRLAFEGREAFRWGFVLALVACPFFIRNWLIRGNPVFPTAYGLFGGEGWDITRAFAYSVTLENYGHGRELVDYLLLPVRLAFERSMHTGFEGSLGPLPFLGFLLGVVLLFVARLRVEKRFEWLLLAAWAGWMFCFWAATVQQVRFFLMAVPAMLALGMGACQWLVSQSSHESRARLVGAITLGLVVLQGAWSYESATTLWRTQVTSEWLRGEISREAVLERMLPESYPPMRALSQELDGDQRVWLVWMRGYTYYLDLPYRLDNIFEAWRLESLLEESVEPRAFEQALAQDEIDYLLINHRFFLDRESAKLEPDRTARLRERFTTAVRDGAIRPVRQWGPVVLYETGGKTTASNSPSEATRRATDVAERSSAP